MILQLVAQCLFLVWSVNISGLKRKNRNKKCLYLGHVSKLFVHVNTVMTERKITKRFCHHSKCVTIFKPLFTT